MRPPYRPMSAAPRTWAKTGRRCRAVHRQRRAISTRASAAGGGEPRDRQQADEAHRARRHPRPLPVTRAHGHPRHHARALRQESARLTAAGLPVPGTFEHTARDWYSRHLPTWSPGHAKKILALLVNDLFPYLGARELTTLKGPEVLMVVRRIEARGAIETAYRALKAAGAVYRHGVQNGLCESDPIRDLQGAVVMPESKHRAAVTDPAKLGQLLRAIEVFQGTPVVRAALTLAPMVFLRPNEFRRAEWSEFDLDRATWTIPSAAHEGSAQGEIERSAETTDDDDLGELPEQVARRRRPSKRRGRNVAGRSELNVCVSTFGGRSAGKRTFLIRSRQRIVMVRFRPMSDVHCPKLTAAKQPLARGFSPSAPAVRRWPVAGALPARSLPLRFVSGLVTRYFVVDRPTAVASAAS